MNILHSSKTWAGLLFGIVLTLATVKAADPASPETSGLQVGKPAPEWTLTDQFGNEHSLKSLIKKGPVALVFYRSANW